jgi:CRP/FNR family transcriptional regulator, polysaccharide utilization system transcription regulator
VCFVPRENFTQLMTGDQEFHQQIVNHYLDEMKETEYRTLHLAHKTVRQKVADALLHVAKAYNYQRNASGMHIQLDRQDFADLASTTKEQVSKVLFDLKKEQLIHFRAKHFKYLDVEALKKIVEEQSVN